MENRLWLIVSFSCKFPQHNKVMTKRREDLFEKRIKARNFSQKCTLKAKKMNIQMSSIRRISETELEFFGYSNGVYNVIDMRTNEVKEIKYPIKHSTVELLSNNLPALPFLQESIRDTDGKPANNTMGQTEKQHQVCHQKTQKVFFREYHYLTQQD